MNYINIRRFWIQNFEFKILNSRLILILPPKSWIKNVGKLKILQNLEFKITVWLTFLRAVATSNFLDWCFYCFLKIWQKIVLIWGRTAALLKFVKARQNLAGITNGVRTCTSESIANFLVKGTQIHKCVRAQKTALLKFGKVRQNLVGVKMASALVKWKFGPKFLQKNKNSPSAYWA